MLRELLVNSGKVPSRKPLPILPFPTFTQFEKKDPHPTHNGQRKDAYCEDGEHGTTLLLYFGRAPPGLRSRPACLSSAAGRSYFGGV